MSEHNDKFWLNFKKKNFKEALKQFETFDSDEKETIFAELFEKSEHQRKPSMISVLRGTITENNSFDDFYNAWLPKEVCNPVEKNKQSFQQVFSIPVRVINGINIDNSREIISVGIIWANSDEENKLETIIKQANSKNSVNSYRHNSIDKIADRELLGLFSVKTDDNLGVPFSSKTRGNKDDSEV